MENVYSWLFILCGSTITVLGAFLIGSGRQLRSERRQFEHFKRDHSAGPVNPSKEPEAHSPAEPIAKNEELAKEILSLSNRLEESQRMLEERESEKSRLLGVQSENQQLQEQIGRLNSQLETSQIELQASFGRIQEAADAGTALQHEIAELKRQLAERETAIETLREAAQRAAALQSENQRLQERNAYAERSAIVEQHAQLQTRLAETMQQIEELTAKDAQLLKEADELTRRLTASEENANELRASEQSARLNTERLIEVNEQLQREVADFRQQLAAASSQLGESAMSQLETAEWNRKLQSEIGDLKQRLEQRQATSSALQNAERRCSELQSEGEKLRVESEGLQKELDGQKIQLIASESRSLQSGRRNQELTDRCERLEMELADYRQQLEDSQSKHREIDNAEERLANAESRAMIYRDQQRKLEEQIIDLKRELSGEKDKVRELDDIQKRLVETEGTCQELGEENRRLLADRARWQEHLTAREDGQRQVSMLQKQLEKLQTEGARLIEVADQAHEPPVTVPEDIGSWRLSSDPDRAEATQATPNTSGGLSSEPLGSIEIGGNQNVIGHSDSTAEIIGTQKQNTSRRIWSLLEQKWCFGALSAAVVAIAVAVALMGDTFSTSNESAVAAGTSSDEFSPDDVTSPKIKAATRLPGTYETVRTTPIYTEPSENSALISNIGPKTKLNVVGSSNGWLEIRSRHGRPPGFIRQEAAVRTGRN